MCFLTPCCGCVCGGEGCCDNSAEGEVFYVFCVHGAAFFVDRSLKVLILYINARLYRTDFLVILVTSQTPIHNHSPKQTTTQSCTIETSHPFPQRKTPKKGNTYEKHPIQSHQLEQYRRPQGLRSLEPAR